jgi:hypothetical protein
LLCITHWALGFLRISNTGKWSRFIVGIVIGLFYGSMAMLTLTNPSMYLIRFVLVAITSVVYLAGVWLVGRSCRISIRQ